MIISVASGKGGTGKTTIATGLALSLVKNNSVCFIDCDVEEPNAHFFLKPKISRTKPALLRTPEIIEEKCTYCGRCAEICAFNAIAALKDSILIFPELCHGCGGCKLLCPESAILEKGRKIGMIESGNAGDIRFVKGILDIGQALSPPVIREIKKSIGDEDVTILDAPPGTSCPMIETVKQSDFVLLVTEPTPFGFNDLSLAVESIKKMRLPFGIIINRARNEKSRVHTYCEEENLPLLLEIPWDKKIATAYSKGISLIECYPDYQMKFEAVYKEIKNLIKIHKYMDQDN